MPPMESHECPTCEEVINVGYRGEAGLKEHEGRKGCLTTKAKKDAKAKKERDKARMLGFFKRMPKVQASTSAAGSSTAPAAPVAHPPPSQAVAPAPSAAATSSGALVSSMPLKLSQARTGGPQSSHHVFQRTEHSFLDSLGPSPRFQTLFRSATRMAPMRFLRESPQQPSDPQTSTHGPQSIAARPRYWIQQECRPDCSVDASGEAGCERLIRIHSLFHRRKRAQGRNHAGAEV